MKVWKINGPDDIRQSEVLDAVTAPGTAKVKISKAGISLSDVEALTGASEPTYPIVPGHQAVGIVSEVDSNDRGIEKGQRVYINPYVPCKRCIGCISGDYEHCSHLKTMGIETDGLLRDFVVTDIESLHQLPSHVKDTEALFIEHVAMAVRIFTELDVRKGDHIAIYGSTLIGLALAQVALYYQAIPILIDSNAYRLELAHSLSIYYTIDASVDDAAQKLLQITGGRGCEKVAHLASTHRSLRSAFDFCGNGARLAVAGHNLRNHVEDGDYAEIINKQLTVIGIDNCYAYVANAINLIANKAIDTHLLVDKEIGFGEVPSVLREIDRNPYVYNKVVVKI